MVELLVAHAADVGWRDAHGSTPLAVGLSSSARSACGALLRLRADPNARAVPPPPPRRAADKGGAFVPKVHRNFFESHASNAVDDYSRHVRQMQAEEARRQEQERRDVEAMAAEVETEFKVNHLLEQHDEDSSALSCSDDEYSFSEAAESVKLTTMHLSKVAPLRRQDMAGAPGTEEEQQRARAQALELRGLRSVRTNAEAGHEPPLMMAARRGLAELCTLLLQHSADASATDTDGDVPLCAATRAGHTEAALALLQACPCPTEHSAAVKLADQYGHDRVLQALRGYQVT